MVPFIKMFLKKVFPKSHNMLLHLIKDRSIKDVEHELNV